jgi:type I restriction enzyme, S subunit
MKEVKLQKYSAYKDSGVEWLGEIPEHWEVLPGLRFIFENKDRNKGMIRKTVLSLSYGNIRVKEENELTGLVPESFETYQFVNKGDLIFRPTDLQNDTVSLRSSISEYEGIITNAYLNLRFTSKAYSKFYHYFFRAIDNNKVIYGLGSGLRQNISYLDFRRFKFPFPPLSEQIAIANFLDTKTALIDKAIALKQKQIELLKERRQILIHRAVTRGLNPHVKLKDSGVEWIGEIPEHWEVKFNRRLFREKNREITNLNEVALSLSQVDGVIPSEDMKERSLTPSHRDNFKLCMPNDLIVNRFKGHLGVFFESKFRGVITFHYGVFTPESNINSKYYEYLFHTDIYKTIYAGASNGMTIGLQNLSNQNFYNIKSIVPPYVEQTKIIEYIELISSKISTAIALKEKEIEKLKEYKSVLINEAVSGKIKVKVN